jgi:acetoin utilization protein AcuB
MASATHTAVSAAKKLKAVKPPRPAVSLQIEAWMKTPVHTVKPQDSVAHARAILEEYRVNQLPVVQNGKLVGIVTDRDLRDAPMAVRVSGEAAGRTKDELPSEPNEIPVSDVMSDAVLTMTPSNTLEHAARLMREQRIGAVPIVEKQNHLAGILTRSDVLEAFVALAKSKQGKR